jgi:hypothetical protein
VPGAIAILVVLALIPVIICLSSAALAAAIGWALNRDAEVRNQGSELLDLNI